MGFIYNDVRHITIVTALIGLFCAIETKENTRLEAKHTWGEWYSSAR
jgi:hypothetical protein